MWLTFLFSTSYFIFGIKDFPHRKQTMNDAYLVEVSLKLVFADCKPLSQSLYEHFFGQNFVWFQFENLSKNGLSIFVGWL